MMFLSVVEGRGEEMDGKECRQGSKEGILALGEGMQESKQAGKQNYQRCYSETAGKAM